jgi:hypothetical protein
MDIELTLIPLLKLNSRQRVRRTIVFIKHWEISKYKGSVAVSNFRGCYIRLDR